MTSPTIGGNNTHSYEIREVVFDQILTIADVSAITLACRWERHSILASRWLAEEYANLSVDDRLKFSGESARAASARNNAVDRLHIELPTDGLGFALDPDEGDADADHGEGKELNAPSDSIDGPGDEGGIWGGLRRMNRANAKGGALQVKRNGNGRRHPGGGQSQGRGGVAI